jgi:hypothetical protein
MDAKFHDSQNLTLLLNNEEDDILKQLKKPTKDFFDIMIYTQGNYSLFKAYCKELLRHILLGFSFEKLDKSRDNRYFEIVIPEGDGFPWKINLSEMGREFYLNGWQDGVKYDKEHNLFIAKRRLK